jgi:hypothetical protein
MKANPNHTNRAQEPSSRRMKWIFLSCAISLILLLAMLGMVSNPRLTSLASGGLALILAGVLLIRFARKRAYRLRRSGRFLQAAFSLIYVLATMLSPALSATPAIAAPVSAESVRQVIPTAPAAGPSFAQTYFVPLPEDQIRSVNLALQSTTGNVTTSGISIVVTKDNTFIYYDEWENGYELDLGAPTQTNTKIWGDGNNANGNVSTVCPTCAGDTLNAGDVINLVNDVTSPRNSSTVLYDGRDKFSSNYAVQVVRAAWPVTPGTVLAGAEEVTDTSKYGQTYDIPVGQNVNSAAMFEHVALFVLASKDNTSCTFNGSSITTLNQGQSYLKNGGVNAGDVVQCDKPVYANLIAGDIEAGYESRWYSLFPTDQWANNYYNPVGSVTRNGTSQDTIVFIFNPSTSSTITVNYTTQTTSGSFNVSARGVYQYTMPQNQGARFYTSSNNFFAVANVGAAPANNQTYDWGITLVPANNLTPVAVVGWAPGSDDQSPDDGIPDENTAPVWVTPVAATTIYVDFDGDPTTGPNTAPNGEKYNVSRRFMILLAIEIRPECACSQQMGPVSRLPGGRTHRQLLRAPRPWIWE